MGKARTILHEDDCGDGVAEHVCVRECPSSIERCIRSFKIESSKGKPKPDVEIYLCGSPFDMTGIRYNWRADWVGLADARLPYAWFSLCDMFDTFKFQAGDERIWASYPLEKIGPADKIFRTLIVHQGTI